MGNTQKQGYPIKIEFLTKSEMNEKDVLISLEKEKQLEESKLEDYDIIDNFEDIYDVSFQQKVYIDKGTISVTVKDIFNYL